MDSEARFLSDGQLELFVQKLAEWRRTLSQPEQRVLDVILTHEVDAYLFNEGEGPSTTKVEVSKQGAGPVVDSSASRPLRSARTSRGSCSQRGGIYRPLLQMTGRYAVIV